MCSLHGTQSSLLVKELRSIGRPVDRTHAMLAITNMILPNERWTLRVQHSGRNRCISRRTPFESSTGWPKIYEIKRFALQGESFNDPIPADSRPSSGTARMQSDKPSTVSTIHNPPIYESSLKREICERKRWTIDAFSNSPLSTISRYGVFARKFPRYERVYKIEDNPSRLQG
jgi:hypothetical protein